MLKEIKRYTFSEGQSYGVESPQEAYNNEQRCLRKKRIHDGCNLKEDEKVTSGWIIDNMQGIVDAVVAADSQILADNRDFIVLNRLKTNNIKISNA